MLEFGNAEHIAKVRECEKLAELEEREENKKYRISGTVKYSGEDNFTVTVTKRTAEEAKEWVENFYDFDNLEVDNFEVDDVRVWDVTILPEEKSGDTETVDMFGDLCSK